MKYAKYNIEEGIVEVYNSILGMESIVLNGEKVSKNCSVFGSEHTFRAHQNSYKVTTQTSFFHLAGVEIRLYKNGEYIRLENQISKSKRRWLIMRFVFGLFLGASIGFAMGWSDVLIDWGFQALGL
jgi:hypothetical protein